MFFASFCWLWDFLLQNLKLKRNSEDVRWYIWPNAKKLCTRNNNFKKRIPNMAFWIIYILVQISFLGTALGCFSHCFLFKFFVVGQPWWLTLLLITPPPALLHHKRASDGLVNTVEVLISKALIDAICVKRI